MERRSITEICEECFLFFLVSREKKFEIIKSNDLLEAFIN